MPRGGEGKFERHPHTLAVMLHALRPSPKHLGSDSFQPIRLSWRQQRISKQHLAEFLQVTGFEARHELPFLYLHAVGFRLQMRVLTHPHFPIPIWRTLQIRNQLVQHAPIPINSVLYFETSIQSHRILDKGLEVDLHTTIQSAGELISESLNTFYYRGRFGTPQTIPPQAQAPKVGGDTVATWHTPARRGWGFSRLTGDYNAIHSWNWYAQLMGFARAFQHPQASLGQCMSHLSSFNPSRFRCLDVWLKGPVYYNSEVRLKAKEEKDAVQFALEVHGEMRPAILGYWSSESVLQDLLRPHPCVQ